MADRGRAPASDGPLPPIPVPDPPPEVLVRVIQWIIYWRLEDTGGLDPDRVACPLPLRADDARGSR
jgi:hypothetical protein